MEKKWFCFYILLFLFAVSGCVGAPSGLVVYRCEPSAKHVGKVAVLPVLFPHCEGTQAPQFPPSAEEPHRMLELLLCEGLQRSGKTVSLVASESAEKFRNGVAGANNESISLLVKELGETLGVDALLVASLHRWRELRGTWYAAREPASVTFEFRLYRVGDGALVLWGVFEQTQAALSDDLALFADFLKRGGRWVKAEALMEDGVEKAVAELAKE